MDGDEDEYKSGWLLLLAQLPKTPSSARVTLWRRLRAAGATTLVNSSWVLPASQAHNELLGQLQDGVIRQGGTAFVLQVPDPQPEVHKLIVSRLQADRGREYDEFAERSTALLAEIGKESGVEKYTFAELEESEHDLEKLARWLAKIQARDFFPDERAQSAVDAMARCQSAVESFAQAVYAAEGVTGSGQQLPDNEPDS